MLKAFLFLTIAWPVFGALAPTGITANEKAEVINRLKAFYAHPEDPSLMSRYVPKYSTRTGLPIHPNAHMAEASPSWNANPLMRYAGKKVNPAYQAWRDKHFHGKKKAPKSPKPHPWGTIEDNDLVDDIIPTWIDEATHALDELPGYGETSLPIWGDDYWRMAYGQTSYRYGDHKKWEHYSEAVASYAQPESWVGIGALPDLAARAAAILPWSPAEKYDLAVGDEAFTMTNEEKALGEDAAVDEKGEVESWMGICHGWAVAAITVPRPEKPADVTGPGGVKVHFYPNDIRALASLAWASSDFDSNFIGGRCDIKNATSFPNGRIRQQECFDNNPATWHLTLANMIGRAKASFVIDSTFDYEVWNQPVKTYEFAYFNPLKPQQNDPDWRKVAIDYNADFKKTDRFQHPMTRGRRLGRGKWDDSGIKKIVGVMATVVYLDESVPTTTDAAAPDNEARITYTYDLELHEGDDGELYPEGGEWYDNFHPDFIWGPQRGAYVASDYDAGVTYHPHDVPSAPLTAAARASSDNGMPLCKVLRGLLEQSAGAEKAAAYSCGE